MFKRVCKYKNQGYLINLVATWRQQQNATSSVGEVIVMVVQVRPK